MRKLRKPVPKKALVFDCPWEGHVFDPNFVIRNSSAPNVVGHRCVKCKCLIYLVVKQSSVLGVDGVPLPKEVQ